MNLWSPCCMEAALRLRTLRLAGYSRRAIMDDPEWQALADLGLGR